MISRIYRFFSGPINRLFPVKFRTWINDDFIPVCGFLILFFVVFHQSLLMIYACWKWKGGILYCLAYILWTRYDSKTMRTVGRKIPWISGSSFFKCFRSYFPSRLIKLTDLPPNKNYIVACYPHAVIPYGGILNLCTSANNAPDLFPNIDIRPVSNYQLFYLPGLRELFMAMGICTNDLGNVLHMAKSAPPKALVIWPGAFDELTYSCLGSVYTISIRQKGFIIVALQSGASLVPAFSFGEQNTLECIGLTGPLVDHFNERFYKYLKTNIFFWKGRGGYGSVIPYRRPVTTVVGKPIAVPRCENPTVEIINKYHEKFSKALRDLFEEYKGTCDEAGDAARLIMK